MVAGSNPGGNPPDEESITKNQFGEIQVSRPSDDVVGRFEDSMGDWSYTGTSNESDSASLDSNRSFKGNKSLKISTPSDSISYNRKIDVTSVDNIKGYFYLESGVTGAGLGIDQNQDILYGDYQNAETWNQTTSSGSWIEVTLDVSNQSGEYYLFAGAVNGDGSGDLYIDHIFLDIGINQTVDGGAG
jgi:hypothetical protein